MVQRAPRFDLCETQAKVQLVSISNAIKMTMWKVVKHCANAKNAYVRNHLTGCMIRNRSESKSLKQPEERNPPHSRGAIRPPYV